MASDIIQPAPRANQQLTTSDINDSNFIDQCKRIIAYRDKVALNALKQKIVQSRAAAAATTTTAAAPAIVTKDQTSSFVSKPIPKVHKDFEAERVKLLADIRQDYQQSLAPRRIDPAQFGFREDAFLRSLKEAVGPPQPYQGPPQRPDHIPPPLAPAATTITNVNKVQSQNAFNADVYGIGTSTPNSTNNTKNAAALEQAKANYPIKQEDDESDDQYEPQEASFSGTTTATAAAAPIVPTTQSEPIPGLKHIQSGHPSPESHSVNPPAPPQPPAASRRPLKRYDDEDFQHSAPQRKVARTDQVKSLTGADMYGDISSSGGGNPGPQYTDQSYQLSSSIPYGSEPQTYSQYPTPVVRHPQPSRYLSTPRLAHMSPTMVANNDPQARRQSAIPLYSDAHPSDVDTVSSQPPLSRRDTYSPTFDHPSLPQHQIPYPYSVSRNRSGIEPPPDSRIGQPVILPPQQHQTDSPMSEYDPLHPEIPMSKPNDMMRYGPVQQQQQQQPLSTSASSSYLRPPPPPVSTAFRMQQQQEPVYAPYTMRRSVQHQSALPPPPPPAGSEIAPNPYMMYRKHPSVPPHPSTALPRYTDAYPAEPVYGDMHPTNPPPPPASVLRPESRVYYHPPQSDYNPYYNGM